MASNARTWSADQMIAAVVDVLKGNASQREAATTYALPRVTLGEYVRRAKEELERHHHQAKRAAPLITAGAKRVLAIGDLHDNPWTPKDRCRWIGKHIAQGNFDQVVQIGDFADIGSLNQWDKDDTLKGRAKPTFDMDLASFDQALTFFSEGMSDCRTPLHVTLGNHEDRIWRAENVNPAMFGNLRNQFTGLLSRHGWTWSKFGEYWNYEGVDFIHAPMNGANKPMGGENVAKAASRDTLRDLVFGHTHRKNQITGPKLNNERVTILELACAMPDGQLEAYVGTAKHGWSWGVTEITISTGRIEGYSYVSMAELERRYA